MAKKAAQVGQVKGPQSISFMTEVQEFKYESQNIRTVYLGLAEKVF